MQIQFFLLIYPWESVKFQYLNIFIRCWNRPVPLPEVLLAEFLLLDVPLLDVPLAEVPQPLDPEPMDSEVAEPVPEQESSWRIMSSMSLDKELTSLLFPSPCELACQNKNIKAVTLKRSLTSWPSYCNVSSISSIFLTQIYRVIKLCCVLPLHF